MSARGRRRISPWKFQFGTDSELPANVLCFGVNTATEVPVDENLYNQQSVRLFGMDSRRLILRDTTLREGVQIPGSDVSVQDRRRFIERIAAAGVPEIEIGLPDGVTACADLATFIRDEHVDIIPTGLVPCYGGRWRGQIDLAAECGLRIDVLVPTSDPLLREKEHYGMSEGVILPRLAQVIEYAEGRGLTTGAALMDACRAPRDRLLNITRQLDVDRIVLYDSVGTMLPWKMMKMVRQVRETTDTPILVHCHNDHGMAVANTLAAFEAGAVAADVSVNGLGGRAGNAALAEVVMGLEQLCGLRTGVDSTRLHGLSAFVAKMTGIATHPLKPIVGRYCFAHVPVMHIRCIAGGNTNAFEPFEPSLVGAERTYGFCLPVDYSGALEPFLAEHGRSLTSTSMEKLLTKLRQRHDWTEKDIRDCIDGLERH